MTHPIRITTIIVAAAASVALLVALLATPPAGAVIPPRNCDFIRVSGKRYNVKADQLRCPRARDYARAYLRYRRIPRGYTCRRYSGSALVFRCENRRASPDKTFFAIKR